MSTLPELPPDQRGISSNEAPPWENLPRIDFSLEEAKACLSAFETHRQAIQKLEDLYPLQDDSKIAKYTEIKIATWEKINFFLLKAQVQGILGFSPRFDQKKTTALALRHVPLEEQDSLGDFRYSQFRAIVDWAIGEGRIEETAWDKYSRKGKFTLAEIGKILDAHQEQVRQWVWFGVRAIRHPSRTQKLHDHCLEIARPEEWERVKREREERKIRDIRSLRELLSARPLYALLRGDISTIPEVLSLSDEELQAIRDLGPVRAREIREALEQYLERLSPETRSALKSEALDLPKAKISRRGKVTFPKTTELPEA